MPSATTMLAFAGTALVVIVIPGPSVLFAVGRALADGRRVALLSVVGNSFGVYAQIVAVAFGVGALAEQSVAALTVLKLGGGLYLIYLGVRTFRHRHSLAAAVAEPTVTRSSRRAFGDGFVVGLTNPKTVVFMTAILPQFTHRNGDVTTQMLILGVIFLVIAMLSDSVWVLAAGRFRSWFASSPRRLQMIGGTGGLAIAAVGAGFIITGRHN